MLKKSLMAAAVCAALLSTVSTSPQAQPVQAAGRAEVEVKKFKDLITARAAARRMAERDAVRSALKLRLNIDASGPQAEAAIDDFVKNLGDNLRPTFRTEGDILTATVQLTVDSAELTDMSRSLGLQDKNVMEAASVVFMIDEYWGVATNLDPSKPLVNEVEYFHDKSSFSDTSAKASGAAFSDTSSKSAGASSYSGSMAASSKESASIAASERSSVAASRSTSVAGSDQRALAAQGPGGSVAAARSTQIAGSQRESVAGSSSSNLAASRSSDTRVAASVQASNSYASDQKNVQAASFAVDQKNVQQQNDVVSVKTRTVFPDVNNAKPSDRTAAMIPERLAQVTKQYGLEYSPEGDIRETGKGRMLIADIETQRRWDEYKNKAAQSLKAKYVVFGTSVMSAEGKSPSGQTICSGMLKLDSFNVDTNRGLIAGTLTKRAQGSSDQNCRANLATALATELAQTVGNAATRELQLIATQGRAYTVTLFSALSIPRRVGGSFEDALRALAAGSVREDKRTESTRTFTVSYKGGDFARRIEKLLDDLGDAMKSAEISTKGNRVVVCLEGKCPADF